MMMAFDRATVRTVDRFGRMYVEVSNISKAAVNPYYGREIPGNEGMGLDPNRVYQLLRDPGELAKAAPSFNNIPLLDRHIPVTADEPAKEFVVGSTGTDAAFAEPFLRNSLVIWDSVAIAGVRTNVQRELSSAYSYDADMTPGVYEGVPYDGIMRNIRGNHVALVEVGRAGPEVVVGDSKLSEKPRMKKLTANAKVLRAALTGLLTPMIAQDAQIGDLTAIAGSVKTLKGAKNQTTVIDAVTAAYGDKLAADATLDALPGLLKTLAQDESEDPPEKKPEGANDADEDDEGKKKTAEDEDDDKVDKPAMDAAIAAARQSAVTETIAKMRAIQQAERDVEPHVGALAVAQDSAEAVYRIALDAAKVDHEGINDVKALRAMVGMLPKAGDAKAPKIAQDSAAVVQGAALFDSIFSK